MGQGEGGTRQGGIGEGRREGETLTSWALLTLFEMSCMSFDFSSDVVLVVSSDPQTVNTLL